jgi:hypothetical protein
LQKQKKITVSEYKNVDSILDSIIKSAFIPFAINGKVCYKKKYIDGVLPYIFPLQNKRKVLYIDITSGDKIYYLINAKNEKNNFHRIMSGILDIHHFFIKNCKSHLCSYVNDWGIFDVISNIFKKIIEKIIIYIVYFILFLKKRIRPKMKKSFIYNVIIKYLYFFYTSYIDLYCC